MYWIVNFRGVSQQNIFKTNNIYLLITALDLMYSGLSLLMLESRGMTVTPIVTMPQLFVFQFIIHDLRMMHESVEHCHKLISSCHLSLAICEWVLSGGTVAYIAGAHAPPPAAASDVSRRYLARAPARATEPHASKLVVCSQSDTLARLISIITNIVSGLLARYFDLNIVIQLFIYS